MWRMERIQIFKIYLWLVVSKLLLKSLVGNTKSVQLIEMRKLVGIKILLTSDNWLIRALVTTFQSSFISWSTILLFFFRKWTSLYFLFARKLIVNMLNVKICTQDLQNRRGFKMQYLEPILWLLFEVCYTYYTFLNKIPCMYCNSENNVGLKFELMSLVNSEHI